MIGRLIKRIFHRLIRGLVVHPIRGVIVLAAILVASGVLIFQNVQLGMPSLSLPGMGSLPFRPGGGPPEATESYLKGTESYNAELVWSSLSEEALARYRNRGGNLQTMQNQMEQAKQAGTQLADITYIGGQSLPDGTSMHFYTVLARGPQSRGEAEYVPYVFTLDNSGKISRVQ